MVGLALASERIANEAMAALSRGDLEDAVAVNNEAALDAGLRLRRGLRRRQRALDGAVETRAVGAQHDDRILRPS